MSVDVTPGVDKVSTPWPGHAVLTRESCPGSLERASDEPIAADPSTLDVGYIYPTPPTHTHTSLTQGKSQF